MHPDGYNMTYDDEWPKTVADYEKLFALKSFELQEIYTNLNEVDGKDYTTGIKFRFQGEKEPITYGKTTGTHINRALFKSSE